MPRRAEQVNRVATEREVVFNIERARKEADLAASPKGLTSLAQGFWFKNQKAKNRAKKQ